MTTEGTARGRCHWQRPLVVLDPSLLQIDDADRAALGGGFHSGQVRRAGLAVDLRQPVLRDPEFFSASGPGRTAYSPWQCQFPPDRERSVHSRCIVPYTPGGARGPERWHSPFLPPWLSHMPRPGAHAPACHSRPECWRPPAWSGHSEYTGPESGLHRRARFS